MSTHVTSVVWRHSTVVATAKLVLLALADQANDDGWCDIGQDNLAERTGMARRTVQRQLDTLLEAGEVEVHAREGYPNLYRVTVGGVRHVEGGVRHSLAVTGSCAAEGCDYPLGHTGPHRNPWFDAIPIALGYQPPRVPEDEEGLAGRLVVKVRAAGGTPESIVEAARWIAREWGPSKLTLASLLKHYTRATSDLARVSDVDRDAVRVLEREARLRAEITEKARRP